jgi:glutathione S-transferase
MAPIIPAAAGPTGRSCRARFSEGSLERLHARHEPTAAAVLELGHVPDFAEGAGTRRGLLADQAGEFDAGHVAVAQVLDAQAVNFNKLAGILDARLATNDWVAGTAEPTIADIALASPMHLHGWQKLPLADHPNLKRWMLERVEPLACWRHTNVEEGFVSKPLN